MNPNKTRKATPSKSVGILIADPSLTSEDIFERIGFEDYLLVVPPQNCRPWVGNFLNKLDRYVIRRFHIANHSGSSLDLNICPFCQAEWLDLYGFRLSAVGLSHVCSCSSCITFGSCEFVQDWWKGRSQFDEIESLSFEACTCDLPGELPFGNAPRYELKVLGICTKAEMTFSQNAFTDPDPAVVAAAPYLAAAFWSQSLESVRLSEFNDLSFLTRFPALRDLQRLDFFFSELGQEALVWASQCPRLKELRIRVQAGTLIDWTVLSNARHLKVLDICGEGFGDTELAEVLKNTRLRRLDIGSSKVTNAMLSVMLSIPGLERLELGSEQLADIPWDELPPKTDIVTLAGFSLTNEASRALVKLAARYPGVTWAES